MWQKTNRSSGVLSGLFFDFDQTYTFPKTNRSLPENGWLRDKTASFWSPLPILRCSNLLFVSGSGILVYIMCKVYINWKIEISRGGDFSYLSYSKGLIHSEIFHLQLLLVYRYFQEPFAHSQKTTINFAVWWENLQFFTSNSGVSQFCCEKKNLRWNAIHVWTHLKA